MQRQPDPAALAPRLLASKALETVSGTADGTVEYKGLADEQQEV